MKRKTLLAIGVFCFCYCTMIAQSNPQNESRNFNPLAKENLEKYNTYSFKNNFVVFLESDTTNNYYFLDLSKFSSDFEFQYFYKLSINAGYNIYYNHGLKPDKAWFVAKKQKSKDRVLNLIFEFKDESQKKNNTFSETKKNNWIQSQKS